MRVAFCGSGQCGVPSLGAILAAGHEVVIAASQPARHAGRGGALRLPPLAQAARDAGVDLLECPDINAAEPVGRIRNARPDVIVVVDFGQKVRRVVRELAPLGAFNLHGSLLPELRGAAPANWAILRGYTQTGMSTFELVDKMDAGPVYLQTAMDIRPDETAGDLRARFAVEGAALVCRTIDLLASGQASPVPQDESKATLAPMLSKADGVIDWTQPADVVRNRIHGVWPWPAGQAVLHRGDGGTMAVHIARAAVVPGPCAGSPGELDGEMCVATGQGRLNILEIQPAGKRLMPWRDFVNGYRPRRADRFAPS